MKYCNLICIIELYIQILDFGALFRIGSQPGSNGSKLFLFDSNKNWCQQRTEYFFLYLVKIMKCIYISGQGQKTDHTDGIPGAPQNQRSKNYITLHLIKLYIKHKHIKLYFKHMHIKLYFIHMHITHCTLNTCT